MTRTVYRHDRQKIRQMLQEKGVEETLKAFPLPTIVLPMARVLGLMKPYRPTDVAKPWIPFLGTKSDYALAAEFAVPVHTVSVVRDKLGIPKFKRVPAAERWQAQLAAISDEDFQRHSVETLSVQHKLPYQVLAAERNKRGLKMIIKRGERHYKELTNQQLRKEAGEFLLQQYPQLTLAELGEVFGVSRQYMHQLGLEKK